MCGIGGYFLRGGMGDSITAARRKASLAAMQKALAHRGPDGRGMAEAGTAQSGMAGFCHTRLAIIDIKGGAQPFVHGDKAKGNRRMAVANGEIYNHETLRGEITDKAALNSKSDCAVLLPLWREAGAGFVRRLRCMLAAALYDEATGEGCLLRDAFGIKPLYYFEAECGIFFASEITALRAGLAAAGIAGALCGDGNPDPLAVASLLDRQFIMGGRTPFHRDGAGIKKLAPGEVLTIKHGRITERLMDSPLASPLPQSRADALDAMLEDSVTAHQLADVPFGMFFSGGVDSSSLMVLMARLREAHGGGDAPAKNTPGLAAYMAGFDGEDLSTPRMLAQKCSADFIDVSYGEAEFINHAGEAVAATDDPVADYAILPTTFLARRAARDVKVILTGEGGDEFFAGYGRYRAALRPFFAKPMLRPGPALRGGILADSVAAQLHDALLRDAETMPGMAGRIFRRDESLRDLQMHDIAAWLPDNLLIKLDRCLMRYGVEGRVPFIDRRLSAYALGLAAADKIRKSRGKYILKEWLARELPEAEPHRRKRGFTPPVGKWIAAHAKNLSGLLAGADFADAFGGVIRQEMIPALLADAGRNGAAGLPAWRVVYYALWHQIHVKRATAEQPLFDILAHR